MTIPKLNRENLKVEVECVKSRMEINSIKEEVEEEGEVEEEELEMVKELKKKEAEIYDSDSKN